MIDINNMPLETAVLRQGKLIGRQDHIDSIKRAIEAVNKDNNYVFFLTGEGGIGKTRLLNEIGQYVEALPEEDGNRFLWSGIIDLYHSDMHSNSRIEETLIDALDKTRDFFQEYDRKREAFEKQRLAGLSGFPLEKQRQELTAAFTKGFQDLTRSYHVILTFDTLELVQYENSTVRDLCEVEDEGVSSVKNWLLDQVAQFENTVTIFAGRPHENVQSDFARFFENSKNCVYDDQHIERFTHDETKNYLFEMAKRYDELGKALDEATINQIYQGTDQGRPIYINLMADLLSFGNDIADIFPLTPIPITEEYRQEMKRGISRRLVDLPGLHGIIVRYLAMARQGVDAELLLHLLKGSSRRSEIDTAIQEMKEYTFIKNHPQKPDQIFLHDEVYDILDEFHLDDRQHVDRTFAHIRDYYEEKREAAVQQREEMGALASPQEFLRHEELLRTIADLSAITLHYELQVNPLAAYYQKYVRWDEEAIKAHQVGYDMRLRDIVLTFFNSLRKIDTPRRKWLSEQLPQAELDRMNAVLWLRRYLSRGDVKKCYRIALKMGDHSEPTFQWKSLKDKYYQAALLTIMGEAMLNLSMDKEATLKVLNTAIAFLDEESEQYDSLRDEYWRRARILGRAYNNKAFVYRLYHQYSTAVEPFRQAIALYRQVDIRDEMADSINNLALVYANLGALDEAEALADDGRDLRERLAQRYPLGLSYNTLGAVNVAAQHPHQARGLSEQALGLFSSVSGILNTGIGFERGQAYARFTLGKAYRGLAHLADNYVYTTDETKGHFKTGRSYLRKSIDYFDGSNSNYEIEAKAELGRLYRDWMKTDLRTGNSESAQERKDLAMMYFEQALVLCEQRGLIDETANLLEDIARLHWAWKDKKATEEYLDMAEAKIPSDYKPELTTGFAKVPEPVNPLWVALGKIYLLRAELIFNPDDHVGPLTDSEIEVLLQSMEYRLLAVACFEHYSPFAGGDARMKETRKAMYNSLKRYGVPRLEKIRAKMEEVSTAYDISFDSVFEYIDRTMGFYFIVPDAV